MVGRLCLRTDSLRGSKTVQLLLAGITYDQNLFNPSLSPNSYSYVYAATSRGYSTFVVDRLGTGLSAKPDPALLTTQSHAYMVGQIVQKLRAGTIGGRAFTNVVGVGHSFGTGILQYLAATSTVAGTVPDYLILGAFLSTNYAPTVSVFISSLYPAASDPKFASSGLPAGYITTVPGSRTSLFVRAAGAESAMPAYEESVKAVASTSERATVGDGRSAAVLAAVRVPSYIVVGQYDALYCDEATSGLSCANSAAIMAREGSKYPARACLSAYVVPNAGHAYGLHIRGLDAYIDTLNWIDRYTISGTKNANGCVV